MKDGNLKWDESRKLLVLLLHPNLRAEFRHTSGVQCVIMGQHLMRGASHVPPCGASPLPHGSGGPLCYGQPLLPQRAELGSDGVQQRAAQGQYYVPFREKGKEAFNSLLVPVTPRVTKTG